MELMLLEGRYNVTNAAGGAIWPENAQPKVKVKAVKEAAAKGTRAKVKENMVGKASRTSRAKEKAAFKENVVNVAKWVTEHLSAEALME